MCYLHYLGVSPACLVLFHVGVCLGRVYYMCHWLMDTMASTVLGYFICRGLIQLLHSGIVLQALLQLQKMPGTGGL